jgi:hypothetical protein
MRRKVHPLSHAVYEELGDGLVRVTKGEQQGVFKATGQYVEGDLTFADLHMLVWVGGRELPRGANRGQRQAQPEILHD